MLENRLQLTVLVVAGFVACGSTPTTCQSNADCAVGTSCRLNVCSETDGGAAAGGTSGGSGSSAGGAAGGASGGAAGGTSGGTAGGTSGGAAGGTSGGTAGGTSGGASGGTAGGASGGTGGGAAGGSSGGPFGPDGGLVCTTPLASTPLFASNTDAGFIIFDMLSVNGALDLQLLDLDDRINLYELRLTSTGLDAGLRVSGSGALLGRAGRAFSTDGTAGLAWTPTNLSASVRFVRPNGVLTPTVVTGPANGFDVTAIAWNSTAQEFASFHVTPRSGMSASPIAMQRWTTDGGLLGTSTPIASGIQLNQRLVTSTQRGYLVGTSNGISLVPLDGGSAAPRLQLPGLVTGIASAGDELGVLFRQGDALWFTRVSLDGAALVQAQPTRIDPAANLYAELIFDGTHWRVAFVHQPTRQLWLATLQRTGTLDRLEPLSCDAQFWNPPNLVALGDAGVAVNFTNEFVTAVSLIR